MRFPLQASPYPRNFPWRLHEKSPSICPVKFPRLVPSSLILLALSTLNAAGDWPRFLGPDDDAKSAERSFEKSFPPGGLEPVWEAPHGLSHTPPVVADGRLFRIHLLDGQEVVEARDAETGNLIWDFERQVQTGASYGISDAPRSSPVVDGDQVFVVGVNSHLVCFKTTDGTVLWERDLEADYGSAPFFFGRGGGPLVWKDRVIVNVGAKVCVAAFDRESGETRWVSRHRWNGSYASPQAARLHGRDAVLVFAGGMTDPPHGGLLCLDPEDGSIHDEVPWRARGYASVNAATPQITGNAVFITEGYDFGGALIDFSPQLRANVRWKAPGLACQFTTPLIHDGMVLGFAGSSMRGAELVACDLETGDELWRFGDPIEVDVDGVKRSFLFGRGSLMAVDGAYLALGEGGTLAWLDLSKDGCRVLAATQLFSAPETWGLPALANGMLYLNQNQPDRTAGTRPRLLAYRLKPQ